MEMTVSLVRRTGAENNKLPGILFGDVIAPVKVPGGLLFGSEFFQRGLTGNEGSSGLAGAMGNRKVNGLSMGQYGIKTEGRGKHKQNNDFNGAKVTHIGRDDKMRALQLLQDKTKPIDVLIVFVGENGVNPKFIKNVKDKYPDVKIVAICHDTYEQCNPKHPFHSSKAKAAGADELIVTTDINGTGVVVRQVDEHYELVAALQRLFPDLK